MIKRLARIALLMVVAMVPVIVIPQVYDPLGVRYEDDVYQVVSRFQCANTACTRLRLPEGAFTFKSGWTATTNADGSRLVPDSAPGCQVRIALIGDSYTWGPYVSDAGTWVNLLAQQFPAACFFNYGVWGYNSEQVALTLAEQVPANMDYVIYFIFQNDNMGFYALPDPGPRPSALNVVRYFELVTWRTGLGGGRKGWVRDEPRYPDRFAAAIRTLAADPRVRFVGFEGELLVYAVRDMGLDVFTLPVPPEGQRVSPIDDHLNAAGHRAIAQHLVPLVEDLLASHPAAECQGCYAGSHVALSDP
jgi:hypothetical protein